MRAPCDRSLPVNVRKLLFSRAVSSLCVYAKRPGWYVAGCYADSEDDRDLPVGPFSITNDDPYPVCASYCMDKVCNRLVRQHLWTFY